MRVRLEFQVHAVDADQVDARLLNLAGEREEQSSPLFTDGSEPASSYTFNWVESQEVRCLENDRKYFACS